MNPSAGGWNDPPPPGTEVPEEYPENSALPDDNGKTEPLDPAAKIVDPFLKNPEYLEYEKRRHSRSRDRSRHRRRSHSRSKHSDRHKRRYRSRSRSRDRHRRSRSHNRRHRRRRSSSSNRSKHSKSKKEKKRKRSRSRSRRHSRSRSKNRRQRSRSRRDDVRSDSEKEDPANTSGEIDDDDEPAAKENAFKNDGSFLEMFKKMQEEQQKAAEAAKDEAGSSEPKMILPISKRRGGRVLKTGMVEKAKVIDEFMQGDGLDAWSVYMKEVKRYKEACCDDDSKTRPRHFKTTIDKMPSSGDSKEYVLQTAPFDPRFPNTNQTRYCYTSFLEFHRCQKARGTDYAPCEYFKKVYTSICPYSWVEKWDNQLEEGTFAGNI